MTTRALLLLGALCMPGCGDTVSMGDGRPGKGRGADANAGTGGAGASDGSAAAGTAGTAVHDAAHDSAADSMSFEPCALRVCGEACHVCNPNDHGCTEPTEAHHCDPHGACLADAASCN